MKGDKVIVAGIDLGSLTGKALILKGGPEPEIVSNSIIPAGADSVATAHKAMNEALSDTGLSMEDIEYVVATGYGRVIVPFAQRNITEISCHARGANWYFPSVRTVIDMGGQDCKAIRCDQRGKVVNFAMNEKCAAGAGRFMEVMAKLVGEPLDAIGELSLQTLSGPANISSTCVLFAKTEVLGLLRKGVHKNDVLAGASDSLSSRVYSLVSRVGVEKDLVISGGIAKNIGVRKRLEEKLGLEAKIPHEPQIVGALGAALFAKEARERGQDAEAKKGRQNVQ